MVGDDGGGVSVTAVRIGGSSSSSSSSSVVVIAFSHLRSSIRARDSLLSRLHRLTTRDVAHTEGEPAENGPLGRARTISFSLSLFSFLLPLSFSLSLSVSLSFSPFPFPLFNWVSFAASPSLSFSLPLSYTRTSLAFLPADAGKLSRRCQARFHPPAHKGEPKRAGQSNGVISSVGMAGVYRHCAIGNVAFSSSVRSLSVRREFERAARASPTVKIWWGRRKKKGVERRGAKTTANPSLPLKLEVNF